MSENIQQLKSTLKHSFIYTMGDTIRRIASLIMLPIYTHYLTPGDYGILALVTLAVEVVSIILGFRISVALFRYYILEEDPIKQKMVISTVLTIVIFFGVVGSSVLLLVAESLSNLIFHSFDYTAVLEIFAFTLLTNALITVGLSYVRAQRKPVLFVAINLCILILQIILNVIFIIILELGVIGVAYATLISTIVASTLLSIYVVTRVGIGFSPEIFKRMMRFVYPLIFASLGALYVGYVDKYLLNLYAGLTEVGLYSLAGKISMTLLLVYAGFASTWAADRFEIVKQVNARTIFNQVFRMMTAILLIMGLMLVLFSYDIIRLIAAPSFHGAAAIVPTLIFASILGVMSQFCEFGLIYKEKTRYMAIASWLKAIIITAGCLILIPVIGMHGAAISLALGTIIAFYYTYSKSKQFYNMSIEWNKIIILWVIAFPFALMGFLFWQPGIEFIIAKLLIVGVVISIFLRLKIWDYEEKELLIAALEKVTGYFKVNWRVK